MKPLDIIRNGMESDLHKYSHGMLCTIDRVIPIKTGDTILEVHATEEYGNSDNDIEKFNVILANRPPGMLDRDLINKYYAIVFSIIKDRPFCSPAFIVNKTTVDTFSNMSKEEMEKISSQKREFITEPNKG